MAGNKKWDDAAIKDLTFAVLMSANNGQITVNANWDKVTETMAAWGYGFSKGAMNQQWTKKILREFRERHPDAPKRAGGSAASTPSKPTPSKKGPNKRVKREQDPEDEEDELELELEFDSNEDNDYSLQTTNTGRGVKSEIACNRTPRRAASHKKVKYEENSDDGGNLEDHEDFEGYHGEEEGGKRRVRSGKRSRAMYMDEEDDDDFTV